MRKFTKRQATNVKTKMAWIPWSCDEYRMAWKATGAVCGASLQTCCKTFMLVALNKIEFCGGSRAALQEEVTKYPIDNNLNTALMHETIGRLILKILCPGLNFVNYLGQKGCNNNKKFFVCFCIFRVWKHIYSCLVWTPDLAEQSALVTVIWCFIGCSLHNTIFHVLAREGFYTGCLLPGSPLPCDWRLILHSLYRTGELDPYGLLPRFFFPTAAVLLPLMLFNGSTAVPTCAFRLAVYLWEHFSYGSKLWTSAAGGVEELRPRTEVESTPQGLWVVLPLNHHTGNPPGGNPPGGW